MRHAVRSRRFGRSRSERAALVRSLTQALFRYERIQTTLPKAKEAQRAAEHLITKAKTGTLASRRHVESWLQDPQVTKTLFVEIAPRFQQRAGGYTRIVHAGYRTGDGASFAVLELVERKPEPETKTKAKKGKAVSSKPSVDRPAPKPSKDKAPEPPKAKSPEPGSKPESPKKSGGFLGGLRKFFKKGRPDAE